MKKISNGICASKGFKAAGIHSGIKKDKSIKDLCLIYSDVICNVASSYTLNKVVGAPIIVTKENTKNKEAQAIIVNSGNANTCNSDGIELANNVCSIVANHLNIKSSDVVIASTGVIGQKLSIKPFVDSMSDIVNKLSVDGNDDAVEAIMTTDTFKKISAYELEIDGKIVHVGGIAKGSGMINPNMATMLAFVTSDVAISKEMLSKLISEVVDDTFNMVCVDGDTSTNDMLTIMCNALGGNKEIDCDNQDYQTFKNAVYQVCKDLSRDMAKDGEGATKLLECNVTNTNDIKVAKLIAKQVISSSLFKAAMFGKDANWGRILCAIGYTPAQFDTDNIDVSLQSEFGSIDVCKNSGSIDFSEDKALEILESNEIIININMNQGECNGTAWGCDLTYDYVKINGDYRS